LNESTLENTVEIDNERNIRAMASVRSELVSRSKKEVKLGFHQPPMVVVALPIAAL
jgi:hypothetical protein